MANMGPFTSSDDLQKMGITLQGFDTAKRAVGSVNGDQDWWKNNIDNVGAHPQKFLLGQECLDSMNVTCYNKLLQPWRKVADPPGHVTNTKTWTTDFKNFDASDEIEDTYTRDHSLTETTDYSLTEQLSVTANASMSIEGLGDLGMSITADSTEVHSKSTSESTSHNTSFPLKVPGGEGRRVTEQVVETTQQAVYECRVGPTGYLCLEYSNGFELASAPEWLFSGNYASGFVTQTTKSTSIVLTINRIEANGNIIGPPVRPSLTVSNFTSIATRGPETAFTSMLVKPYDIFMLASSENAPQSFALISNKKIQPYSITFVGGDPAKYDHAFRTFQNHVHTQFASKPGSINLHSLTHSGNKWSSGIDYDSSIWETQDVKSHIKNAAASTTWGTDVNAGLKFSH